MESRADEWRSQLGVYALPSSRTGRVLEAHFLDAAESGDSREKADLVCGPLPAPVNSLQ